MIIDSTVTLFFLFSYLARLSSWYLSQLSNSFLSKATARLPNGVALNRTPPQPQLSELQPWATSLAGRNVGMVGCWACSVWEQSTSWSCR